MVVDKFKFLNKILYVISIVSWFYFDYFSSFNDDIKYIIMFFEFFIMLFLPNGSTEQRNNIKRLSNLIYLYIFMLLVSFIFQLWNYSFSLLPLKHFFYYVFPAIFSYVLYIKDNEKTTFYFDVIFFVVSIVFLIKAKDFFNISSILKISFVDSYSPFEEFGFADIYLLLFFYYLKMNKKLYAVLCGFFCYLSFKRFHLVFLVLMSIFYILDRRNKVDFIYNKKLNILFQIIFMLSPFIMLFLYSDYFSSYFYSTFHLKLNDFVMGRVNLTNKILDSWHNGTFINMGLGSVNSYISYFTGGFTKNLHNDSLRLFIETTYLGVFLMCRVHFKNIYKLPYSTICLLFIFITLCVSHIMTAFMTWIIFYYIMYMEGEDIVYAK